MRLDELIRDSGLKKGYIAKELNVSKDTLTNWVKGKSCPALDKARLLADLLGCKIDDLISK